LPILLTVALAHGPDEPTVAPPAAFDVAQFLRANAGFAESDIQRALRGDIVVHGLDADDATIGVAAAALVAVPPAFFIEQVRRIEWFKKSPEVLEIGRLGAAPSVREFARLSLDKGEVEEARRCGKGDCGLKLDDPGIDRLRALPSNGDVADTFRGHLTQYVSNYLLQGNSALITYHDHPRPATLLAELEKILQASPFIAREWPDVYNALAQFSGTLPDGLDGFTYWSKEKVGPRASVSLTHVIIRPPNSGVAVIASKQIYASHYVTASLGFTVLVDQGSAAGPRTLLVYMNRTRVDLLGGLLGGVKRPLVRSRAKAGAERMLVSLRTRLESELGLNGKNESH
jgi:hypothetical protein